MGYIVIKRGEMSMGEFFVVFWEFGYYGGLISGDSILIVNGLFLIK